jgi:hypothetical protein
MPPSILPEQLPVDRPIDPGSLLGFRTPLQEHPLSADGKSASLLTLLGIMFTILARYATHLGLKQPGRELANWATILLLVVFAALALGVVVQAFRTLSPRFPPAPPSLAFFGDIARLSREQYLQTIESLTPQQALEQILNYNYTVSTIVVIKMQQLRRAFRLFKLAFIAWLLIMAVVVAQASAGPGGLQ